MTAAEAVQAVGAIVTFGGLGDTWLGKRSSVGLVLIGCATVVAGALLEVRP